MPNFPGLPDLPALPSIPNFGFDLPAIGMFQIGDLPALQLFDFFDLSGSLTIERVEYNATLDDGTTVPTWAITVNSVDGGIFAGVNGPGASDDATGVNIANVDAAIVVLIPKSSTDKRRWISAVGTGGTAGIKGISDVTLQATGLSLLVNQPMGKTSSGAVNTSLVDFAANPLSVQMSDGSTVRVEHSAAAGPQLILSGTADISFSDFFRVNGNIGVRKTTYDLQLSDGTTTPSNLLTIGGSGLSAFAGVNPGTADAAGLSLSGVNFAFVSEIGRAHV